MVYKSLEDKSKSGVLYELSLVICPGDFALEAEELCAEIRVRSRLESHL
jgi:hypothetical protein